MSQSVIACPVLSAMFACFFCQFRCLHLPFTILHLFGLSDCCTEHVMFFVETCFCAYCLSLKTDLCSWLTRRCPASFVDFHLADVLFLFDPCYLKTQLLEWISYLNSGQQGARPRRATWRSSGWMVSMEFLRICMGH